MRLPWPHRDGDPHNWPLNWDRNGDRDGRDRDDLVAAIPAAPVPSPAATDRLAERLHREIEDLRSDLTDDLLLSLILLGEDEIEGAAGLLEDGSDRLHRFQDRVEGVIADAAVERDAEAVLAEAELAVNPDLAIDPVPTVDPDPVLDPEPARTRLGTAFRIRVLASAAAALLAAVVALVSVEPADGPSLVAASTRSPAPAFGPAQTARDLAPVRSSDGTLYASDGGQVSLTATTSSDRLQALRVIGDRGGILARLGSEPRRTAVATLFGVERLVDQVVTDARRVLPNETVAAVTETLPEIEAPIEESPVEPTTELRPEQPPTEDAPSEQTTTDELTTQDGSEEPGSEEASAEESEEPSEESTEGDADRTTGPLTGDDSGSGSSATDDSPILP